MRRLNGIIEDESENDRGDILEEFGFPIKFWLEAITIIFLVHLSDLFKQIFYFLEFLIIRNFLYK